MFSLQNVAGKRSEAQTPDGVEAHGGSIASPIWQTVSCPMQAQLQVSEERDSDETEQNLQLGAK